MIIHSFGEGKKSSYLKGRQIGSKMLKGFWVRRLAKNNGTRREEAEINLLWSLNEVSSSNHFGPT